MIKNTLHSYGSVSKTFHWLVAILVICLLIIGYSLSDFKSDLLYKIHKATGFFLLLLMIARLLWRFCNKVPSYDHAMPKFMALAAHSLHYLLYALLFLMPLSAFIASNAAQYPVSFLFLFDMPSLFAHKNIELAKEMMNIHKILAIILIAAISLHIVAGLYHYYIRKDGILQRMLPFYK